MTSIPNSTSSSTNSDDFSSRLQQFQSTSSQPTVALEVKLAEVFKKRLESTVQEKFPISAIVNLERCLKFVFTTAEKDQKFIAHHIGSSDEAVYENLTSIIRNETLLELNSQFYFEILYLIHKIIQVPGELVNFSRRGLHRSLIFKTAEMLWVNDINFIHLCLSVLDLFTKEDDILLQLSNVNSLEWSLNVLKALIKESSDHRLFTETALKTLIFIDEITNQECLENIDYLGSYKEVFVELLNLLPEEYRETVMAVQEKIASTISNRGRIIRNAMSSTTKSRTSTRYEKGLELRISQLKVNTATSPRIPCLESKKEQFVLERFAVVEMNPETNFYSAEREIRDISFHSVSELMCGMLNSNRGGCIHFGIQNSGHIMGMVISHDQRDGFRSGIDQIFLEELTPLLLPDLVKILFIPILDRKRNIEDLCVIKIVIPPNLNTVFYLKKQGNCFQFIGGRNEKLELPEVRYLAVTMTEKRIAAVSMTQLH